MELFILRHGQAEARAATDADRALTGQGRKQVESVIGRSRDDLANVSHVWVSPYVRAQQTAEIAGHLLGGIEPFTTELLVPEASLSPLFTQLQLCDAEALLLVSHQPLVGSLLDQLCGQDSGYHPMGTASLACVDITLAEAGLGQLRWLRHAEAD